MASVLPQKVLSEHTDCYASDTPRSTLRHALVLLYLILPSCPTRSVSPTREQITFMSVIYSYRSRVIAYQEIYYIICKPCPFSLSPKLYWLFRKNKREAWILPSSWLFALALQTLTPITCCGFQHTGERAFLFCMLSCCCFCRYLNDKWIVLIIPV